jgi:uncharacterized protein
MIRFNADKSLITAQRGDEDDEEYARISGLAVPWDVVATVSDGQKVRFERGAFDVDQKAAKLIQNHDLGQLLGVVDNLDDAEAGLEFEAVLADTAAGRDAVALIKAGAYDAVSVGANPVKFTTDPEGVMSVTEAQLIELSLVSIGAYEEAVITEIAAEAPADADEQGEQDPEDHTDNTEQENPEMSEAKTEAQPIEAEATTPTYPIVYAAKPELPSAVEYISAILKGGHEFDAMRKRVQAAAPEIGTIDTPGILPTPILGPVYNGVIAFRPVVDAIGSRAMPGGGKVFIRPEVTTHTSIAQQAAEFDTLQSGTLVVTDNQVTKKTRSAASSKSANRTSTGPIRPSSASFWMTSGACTHSRRTTRPPTHSSLAPPSRRTSPWPALTTPPSGRVGSTPPLRAFSARQTATCRTTFSCRRTSGLLWASLRTAATARCSRRLDP